ncbi:MAG: hypothetical protein FH748_13140 [Balneolaceae bacterium]|nr:hypothetical protein [Balneolaceae bacterium]
METYRKILVIICCISAVFVIQNCDHNNTVESNIDNNETEHIISGKFFNKITASFIGINHKYVKSFKESSELKSYLEKTTTSGKSLNIIWENSLLLSPKEKPKHKFLMIPIEPTEEQSLSYIFVIIKEGLQLNSNGTLKQKNSLFYEVNEPSLKNNSSGVVFLPMIFQQTKSFEKNNRINYREGLIKRMKDEKTLIHLRKYSDGNVEKLTAVSNTAKKAACENFYDCLSSTLSEFVEDMGWLYEFAAESACGACMWSRGGNAPSCGTCAALIGVPAAEFSIICAIDEDLGIGCEETPD